jgi:S1-C subfamily serine protease
MIKRNILLISLIITICIFCTANSYNDVKNDNIVPRLYSSAVKSSIFLKATEKKEVFPNIFIDEYYSASGFVVNKKLGYIITAGHFAKGGRFIETNINNISIPIEIIKIDESNDIALLKINPVYLENRIEIKFNTNIYIGESVCVIGSPLGLSDSITIGIINKDRADNFAIWEKATNGVWFTDAVIALGSSGAQVINYDGELVGIVVGIFGDKFGVIIPAITIQNFLENK